jgi:uncharacterized membrane protein YfcA
MMMTDPLIFRAVIALGAFFIGFSKGGLGGMMGALITALIALVTPVDQAIGMLLPMLLVGDVFAMAAHWKQWDLKIVRLLVPGTILGVLGATLFINYVSVETLRRTLAVLIAAFVTYRVIEGKILRSLNYTPRGWHGLVAGVIASMTSTLAHVGGPPITIYLMMQKLSPRALVATSALYFSLLNLLKLPGYLLAGLIDPEKLRQILWALPLIPIGVVAGRWAVDRIDQKLFDAALTLLLALSAILLIAR